MNVEIYRGFPVQIEVTDENSLNEVERLIERLDKSYDFSGYEKGELMGLYKTARMIYLDSVVSDNESMYAASMLYERYATKAIDKLNFIRENILECGSVKCDFCVESVDCQSELVYVILEGCCAGYNGLEKIDIRKDSRGLCLGFLNMKESYLAAWQDMVRIKKYGLSVTISNDKFG